MIASAVYLVGRALSYALDESSSIAARTDSLKHMRTELCGETIHPSGVREIRLRMDSEPVTAGW